MQKKRGGQVIMIFLALWEVHIGICYNIFCAFDIFKMFYNLTSLKLNKASHTIHLAPQSAV